MAGGDDQGYPKKEWFERGPDQRTREHWDDAARALGDKRQRSVASPAVSRFYVRAFWIAALIGLICGLVWTAAGLWHFHVHPLW